MANTMLDGLRALDLTDAKAFACGEILAAFGVDVIKVEPPGGDPARLTPPYAGGEARADKSITWALKNAGKRGITLDIAGDEGRGVFLELARRSDFVIESFDPGRLDALGLGYADLAAVNPRLILISITPFGQTGPYAGFKGSELVCSALGGTLRGTGFPDRAPVKEALDACGYHASSAAALAAVFAYRGSRETGEGQHVDVSIQHVAASRAARGMIKYHFDGTEAMRTGNRQSFRRNTARIIWELADGHAFYSIMGGRQGAPSNRALVAWMNEEIDDNPLNEVADWDHFDRNAVTPETRAVWEEAIERFFATKTRAEMAEEGPRRGLNICVANEPEDVLDHPQLLAREFWRIQADDALGARYPAPSHFLLSSEVDTAIRDRAPRVGEHSASVFGEVLGFGATRLENLREKGVI